MANTYTVYMHVTPNNKYYVGITKQQVTERWKNRLGYTSQKLFWRAIQKYGWDNIEHIIIAEHLNHDDACRLEVELIAKYQSNNPKYGYNRTSGGDGTCNFSHPNPHDDEWRRKVGNANRGKKRTEEAKQKMRNAKLGTHWSDERRKQYSKSQKERGFKPSKKCHEVCSEVRRIPIIVYDLKGNFIGEYKTLSEAAKNLNVSIATLSLNLSGKTKSKSFIVKKGRKENENIKSNSSND